MKLVDKLKQQGFGFEQAPIRGHGDRKSNGQCRRTFQEAHDHVSMFADYVDLVRAECLDSPAPTLSVSFTTRDRELTAAIEAEWNKTTPDLDRFKELCDRWQELCLSELKSWLEILRQPGP